MTADDKTKIMKILEAFCNENMGQKVTLWNAPTLLNTVSKELDGIMIKVRPNTAKEE